MITKVPAGPGKVRVTFVMPAAIWADTIHLVGEFNDWDTTATPLRQTEHGWIVTLDLDAGHSYQYRYLFNGQEWHNDWHADRYEPNEFGGDNSVVITSFAREAADSDSVISEEEAPADVVTGPAPLERAAGMVDPSSRDAVVPLQRYSRVRGADPLGRDTFPIRGRGVKPYVQ